jgi:hypothetical protein
MGLAICRSVIEAHHGGMDASTSPLGGARFSFTLPLHTLQDDELAGLEQTLVEPEPEPEPDIATRTKP